MAARALQTVVLILWALAPGDASGITLRIDNEDLENAVVLFTAFEQTAAAPGDLTGARVADTQQGRFRVHVPTGQIPYSLTCQCFSYTFLVEHLESRRRHVFTVTAISKGDFPEQHREVSFTITDGMSIDKGSVSLPIGGFQSSVLTMEGSPRLGVRLSGLQHVEVRVRNNSDSFPVVAFLAPGMHQVQLPEDLFEPPTIEGMGETLVIRPREVSRIRIAVNPISLNAIQHSIRPLSPSDAHTSLALKFGYQVGPFEGDRTAFFDQEIPLRFEPNGLSLVVALFGGSVLGAALLGLSTRWNRRAFLRALLPSFVAAVIIDVVAMLMTGAGSQLILFNYSVDPSQLLPTVAIGIFSGLNGHRSANWIMEWFRPASVERAPEPAGV